jgi:hypothetical protein
MTRCPAKAGPQAGFFISAGKPLHGAVPSRRGPENAAFGVDTSFWQANGQPSFRTPLLQVAFENPVSHA